MKTAKRLLTAALAVVFTFMCALPAMADEEATPEKTYTLTINNSEANHTYEAYQIFAGTFSTETVKDVTEGYLSDINWGTGVVNESGDGYNAMITALTEAKLYDSGETMVEGVNDATKVAMALSKLENKAQEVDAFNEIVGAHLTSTCAKATESQDKKTQVFEGLTAGYYLVKDVDNSLKGQQNQSYTKYLVKLVDTTTISVKSQSMNLHKFIVEDGKEVKANNAAMGETVSYKLTSTLSDMNGYEKYTYIIHDELEGGLTFNGVDSMTVTVGGENYKDNCEVTYSTDGTNYSVTNNATPGQKLYINIELKNLVENDKKGQDVVVTYTATINEKASIGNTPNTNTAYLEYSNNPNQSQDGYPSTAKTPAEHVYTYVAGFEISKKSPKGDDLPGAQFMITGNGMQKLNVIGYSFTNEGDGEKKYYKVEDCYTTVAPTKDAVTEYAAQGDTNIQNGEKIVGMTGDGENITTKGVLRFNGLKDGTYTIKEVLAPTGYKKLDEDITLVVHWSETADKDGNHWTYEVTSKENAATESTVDADGVLHFNIVNQHGLTLPFTGGEGANLLAGLGLALMAAAVAAILYIKRRQNRE